MPTMPLNDVSNASSTGEFRTPGKKAISGFNIPGLTHAPPVAQSKMGKKARQSLAGPGEAKVGAKTSKGGKRTLGGPSAMAAKQSAPAMKQTSITAHLEPPCEAQAAEAKAETEVVHPVTSGAPDPIAGADTPEAEEGESEEQRVAFDEEATVSIPSIAPDASTATVLPVHIEEEEHADDEADDDEEDDAHAEESQSAQPSDNHADRSHRGTMAKELAMLAALNGGVLATKTPGTNRKGPRRSRRTNKAAQAQRFGEFTSWDHVERGACGTPGDALRKRRDSSEPEDVKGVKPPGKFQAPQVRTTVEDVQQRVRDLMKMADAVLPLEEDNGKDDAANQKSLREQLSDSWGGQGYYAKLASQMQTPPAKSILKASRFGAAANNEGACRSAAKNTAVNVAANGPARGMATRRKSVTEAETASSLAKVVEKSDKSKKRVSLGGEAAATLKEAAEKQAVVEDRRRSFGKSTEPPKSAMKEYGNALFNSPGAEDEKSPTTISMKANAMTPAKSVIFTANQAVVFEATPSPMNATATVNAGCESVGPSGPSESEAVAILERQMALLRAELAMTKSDLDAAKREVESLRGTWDPQGGDSEALLQENKDLRAELAAVKKNAAAAVAKMAEVLRAQLNEGMNALGVVEAEALQSLAM